MVTVNLFVYLKRDLKKNRKASFRATRNFYCLKDFKVVISFLNSHGLFIPTFYFKSQPSSNH